MTISKTTFMILSISVALAIFIMIITFIIMRVKINNVKNAVLKNNLSINSKKNKALYRRNTGELLWELKSKSSSPLEDEQLDFLINTVIRNGYKTIKVLNSKSLYELTSFKKLAKMNDFKIHSDLTIIFNHKNLNKKFDAEYKILKHNKMIAIVNSQRRNQEIKKILKHLKLIKAKYDYASFGKGIILVVK